MQMPLFLVACPMSAVEDAVKLDGDKIVSFGLCTEYDACPICGGERSLFDLAVIHGMSVKSTFHSCVRCKLAFDFVLEVHK